MMVCYYVSYWTSYITGRWIHIAAVYDGRKGLINIYVNGKTIYTNKRVDEVDSIAWDGTLKIGEYPVQRGTSPFYLEGYMDEFGIYSTALDEDAVQDLVSRCDFSTQGMMACNTSGYQIVKDSAGW